APLERDEGEYGYMGQLLLRGEPLYRNAYTMKLPGTHAAYALLMWLFGQSSTGIRIGLLAVNAISMLLVFVWSWQLARDRVHALAAAGLFGILAVSPSVLGTYAHATHFVVVFLMAALVLMWRAGTKPAWWRFALAGVLLGVAILMKQHAALFVPLAAPVVLCCRMP